MISPSKVRRIANNLPKIDNGGMAWDIRQFGAKCDGRVSQTGSLSSTSKITDSTPAARLPVLGEMVTWVGVGDNPSVTGATMASSGAAPVITTATPHGLVTGQQATITGVNGAIQANGVWPVTVINSTSFSIALNTSVFGTYTSGGIVRPTIVLFGYVSDLTMNAGTLQFTMVTTKGGSTPVTVPIGAGSGGIYYYGSDDTAAWNAAISKAQSLSATSEIPVRVTWSGTSMVSQTIVVNGNVLLEGDHVEYTNPDGTKSSSSPPQRGSILRAHGNFVNPLSSSLLQLGNAVSTLSGEAGSSILYGVIDACNIVTTAVTVKGSRNTIERTYACNGIQRAYNWSGSNTWGIFAIAGMSNTGDGLYVNSSDCKWIGGYIRQANNPVRIVGGGDFFIGCGAHIFSGYNGGNESYGNDVLIDCAVNSVSKIQMNGVIFDGMLGPHVRIAPIAGQSVQQLSIIGGMYFQPQSMADAAYPLVQIDTTQSTTAVVDVIIDDYVASSFGSSNRYKSTLDIIGAGTVSRVILGKGSVKNTAAIYSGTRPSMVSNEIAIYNGTATVYSGTRSTVTFTGNGTATQFTVAHNLSNVPNDVDITPMTSASIGAWATVDATNITFNFSAAPTNGASLKFSYRAGI